MNLYNVFSAILTLFIIGIVGYFSRIIGILSQDTIDNLPKFLLDITLPCMIISSMQISGDSDRLGDITTILIVSLLVYLLSFLLSNIIPKLFKVVDEKEKGVYQFMTIFSNVSFIGYPVLLSIYSREAIFYGAIYNLPFNVLVFSLGVYILKKDGKGIDLKSFVSPGLISVLIGLVLYAFSIKIPDLILEPMTILGDLTTPLSMIFIGASLSNINIKNIFFNWRLYAISFVRLIFLPLVLFFVLKGFIDDPLLIGVSVIITGMPVAANCAILSKEYGGNAELASEGIFITTMLSMLTIPLLAYLVIYFI